VQLDRCKDQSSITLDDFYANVAEGGSRGGAAMIELIRRLRNLPDERRVFGLTSLHRLCLLAADTWRSPWFVIISALDERNYRIEYRLPDAAAPWPNAYVTGEAQSQDEAVSMILTAMERSGGWAAHPETRPAP
jgi:hypothetical protein